MIIINESKEPKTGAKSGARWFLHTNGEERGSERGEVWGENKRRWSRGMSLYHHGISLYHHTAYHEMMGSDGTLIIIPAAMAGSTSLGSLLPLGLS